MTASTLSTPQLRGPTSKKGDVAQSPESGTMRQDADKKKPSSSYCSGKQVVGFILLGIMGFLFWDAFITSPENRWIRPDSSGRFLEWVQVHPYWGLGAFLLVIATCVVLMIPLGTPLTLGCGYIYKGLYGWGMGVFVGTVVSVLGSGIGAVTCFLLGRYLMRDRVRKWIRNYPVFDAIDVGEYMRGMKSPSAPVCNVTHVNHTSMCSNIGTRASNHGHALLDAGASFRTGELHVWNHIDAPLLVCHCQGGFPSAHDLVCVYWCIDGNSSLRSHWW